MANNQYSRGGQQHRGAQEGHRFYGNQYTDRQDDRRGDYGDDRGGNRQHRDEREHYEGGYSDERRPVRHDYRDDYRGGQHSYGQDQHPRDERGRFTPQHQPHHQQATGRQMDRYDNGRDGRHYGHEEHRGSHPFYGNQYTGQQQRDSRDSEQHRDDYRDRGRRDVSRRDDDDYASNSGDYFNAIGHSHNDTRGGRQGGYHRDEIHHMDRRDYEQAQRDYDRDYERHDYGGGRMNSSNSDSYGGGARQGSAREGEYPSYQGSYGIQNNDRGDYRHSR